MASTAKPSTKIATASGLATPDYNYQQMQTAKVLLGVLNLILVGVAFFLAKKVQQEIEKLRNL
ncbi:hypothetical protein [Thiomicrospira sp. ALE5]|uniref:hypothetical protein n=1 Tax=Thiomicrospira sp. ALE5 TaxID=748650 RepID=UPI000B86916E|nr:hypothetical protein [Thiomicrospira sp. ALE5]